MKLHSNLPARIAAAILPLLLAATTPARSQDPHPAPAAQPARISITVEGVASGKGHDLLLIPGLASSRQVWAKEAALLAPGFRLHLVQVAGFAGEPAGANAQGPILQPVVEELHRYIADNKLQKPAVIGHSLGGLLALMLADSHPADVGKVLVVDALPFYGLVFSPQATVEMVRPQAEPMRDMIIAQTAEQFAASQQAFAGRMAGSAEGQKAVVAASVASDRHVLANALIEDMTTDIRPRLGSIQTPVTVLYPYSSAEGTQAEIDSLYQGAYAGLPNGTFKRIDNSLHFIMFDQPEAFHAAVAGFLGLPAK